MRLNILTEDAMLVLGGALAKACGHSAVIFLHGTLGAGKTTLARGFLRALGHTGHVKSPTYTLVELYELNGQAVYHFDLYRLKDARELEYMGIQDYFSAQSICLVEWPENGAGSLPQADLSCYIEQLASGREVKIMAHSKCGESILQRLKYDE